MRFTRAIARLFAFAPSGRKLPRPDSAEGDAAQRGASAAAGQAGIYVRGLLEAPSGDRNLEDIAQTLLQAPTQLKGVQLRPLIPKLALACGVHVRAAPAAPAVAGSGLARRQQPVHLRRAHRQNTVSDISPKPSVFVFLVGKPLGQQRLEPFATQLLGHLPNPPQHLLHLDFVFGRTPCARRDGRPSRFWRPAD